MKGLHSLSRQQPLLFQEMCMNIVGRYGSESKESPHQYKGAKGSAKDDKDGVIQRIYCSPWDSKVT